MKIPFRSLWKKSLLVLFVFGIHFTVFADKDSWTAAEETEIVSGKEVRGILATGSGETYKTYKIQVPENAFALSLAISGSAADLDLFIKHGEQISNYSDVDAFSEEDINNERLLVTRLSSVPLKPGLYFIDVVYQYGIIPTVDKKKMNEIPFRLKAEIIPAAPAEMLRADVPVSGTLREEEGMYKIYRVSVPDRERALRIDVFDTLMDIDFIVSYNNPAVSIEDADYWSNSCSANETMVITSESDPPLKGGTYYIVVHDSSGKGFPADFSIVATFGDTPPVRLTGIPAIPVPDDGIENTLLSTVEVITPTATGSGCIVSQDGYVLTNFHVIANGMDEPYERIIIAMNLDTTLPPKELFLADIAYYDKDLDLALLKIKAGLYGQELPRGFAFPHFTIYDAETPVIGQPLSFIGFPWVGGTGSKVSVSLTRGVISGFESTGKYVLWKTDAEISSGNSGGAVINVFHELTGILVSTMEGGNDKFAFIIPVRLIPANWLRYCDTE